MTSQALIQRAINKGYGIAAQILGVQYEHYRANGPMRPISTQTHLGHLNADFDLDAKFSYTKPTSWGKEAFYGLFDLTGVQTGDYLVGPRGTFFVSTIEPLKPSLCMFTNAVLSGLRFPNELAVGAGYYGGAIREQGVSVLEGWPATVLRLGSRVIRGEADLPSDPHMPWWEIWLPDVPGLLLETADLLLDENSRPYLISGVERTQMGLRINAIQATT